MLGKGAAAKRVTIYLNESSHWHGKPLYEAILEMLLKRGLAGATVVRALAGFTRGSGLVTTAIVDLASDLPMRLELIDTVEAIDAVLPELTSMLDKGLIVVDVVEAVKYTGHEPVG